MIFSVVAVIPWSYIQNHFIMASRPRNKKKLKLFLVEETSRCDQRIVETFFKKNLAFENREYAMDFFRWIDKLLGTTLTELTHVSNKAELLKWIYTNNAK